MKWRQHRQCGDFGTDPFGQADAMLDGFAGKLRPVRRDQDVGIHRALAPAHLKSHFASCSRIDSNSRRRFALVFG
jgi:hypothetical protein